MKSLLLFLFLAGAAFADEQEVTHRVTHLFAPDREDALRAALARVPEVRLVRLDFERAEALFAYDPKIAFLGAKPGEILQRFNEALRKATQSTMGIAPLDPTPKDRLVRVKIPIAGLDCRACCLAAYESISNIPGVAASTASFKDGRITALIAPGMTDRAALEAALIQRGVSVGK